MWMPFSSIKNPNQFQFQCFLFVLNNSDLFLLIGSTYQVPTQKSFKKRNRIIFTATKEVGIVFNPHLTDIRPEDSRS